LTDEKKSDRIDEIIEKSYERLSSLLKISTLKQLHEKVRRMRHSRARNTAGVFAVQADPHKE
jgi:hypothetical protein